MAEFQVPLDIANRALQHCGSGRIDATLGFNENSKRAAETRFAYGKLRQAELRRNVWRFATRRTAIRPIDTDTFLLAPALWAVDTTYFAGSLVTDANGVIWQSRIASNLNSEPGVNSTWEPYFGPLTVDRYDSEIAYYAGEVVYTLAGDGTYNVYASLVDGNAVHPALPNQWSVSTVYSLNQVVQRFPAYAGGTTYAKGHGVRYTDGLTYASLTDANVGNAPSSSPTRWALLPTLTLAAGTTPSSSPIDEWDQAETYAAGAFVMFKGAVYLALTGSNTGNFPNAAASTAWVAVTDGALYMSGFDLNLGNDPLTAAVDVWVPTGSFVQGGGNSQWLQLGGASFPAGVALSRLNIFYPVGSGPCSQTATRNVYRLPAGFLRRASPDPKAGSASWLGSPSNLIDDDWVLNGDYIVTVDINPIVLRFVADMQDVSMFDPMFCEGLACRVALGVCETLTQSTVKLQTIAKEYDRFMGEARTSNAVEMGPEEAPMDDYLAVRL